MLLLTDGSVMVHQFGSNQWHRCTPSPSDPMGDYANGRWTTLATMPALPPGTTGGTTNAPLYYASAVLKDGRVFVAGGEYNGGVKNAFLLSAQIYDPVADTWSAITTPPGWIQVGDAPCCVLQDGRLLLGNSYTTAGNASTPAIYDPVAGAWIPTGLKNDVSSEETWTLLPDGSVLVVECTSPPNVERLVGTSWIADAPTVINAVPFTLPVPPPGSGNEIGPAILLPNGNVFVIGGGATTPPVYSATAAAIGRAAGDDGKLVSRADPADRGRRCAIRRRHARLPAAERAGIVLRDVHHYWLYLCQLGLLF
jgi:Kelch motif